MTAEGGCLCRAVRYRVSAAPLSSVTCHCRSCRVAAGAPSVAWLTFDRASFQLLAGEPRSFASSAGVTRTFCGACGTPLTYATESRPTHIDVTTVSLDNPALFPPTREIWLEDRLPWEAVDASLEHSPRGSGS
jgi:hypothetical protein